MGAEEMEGMMREIAWKDLNHIVAQLKIAVEHKDDEWFADYLIEALWVMVNELRLKMREMDVLTN